MRGFEVHEFPTLVLLDESGRIVWRTQHGVTTEAKQDLERFLHGYPIGGKWHRPPFEVVAAYVDQKPEGDLSRGRSEEFGFKIFPTVAEALRSVVA